MIEYYYIDYFENKRKILSIQNFGKILAIVRLFRIDILHTNI